MPDASLAAAPPKRRWYQFSLRTLFVVVTLLAIPCSYVGWQAGIVRKREAMRPWLREHGWRVFPATENYEPLPAGAIPWIRRCFGDEPVFEIGFPPSSDASEINDVRATFPEAHCDAMPARLDREHVPPPPPPAEWH